jgi:hypothetical protein
MLKSVFSEEELGMTRTFRLSSLFVALAVLGVTPGSADSYLVYSQGGLPPATDLFTWCPTQPICDVNSPVACDTPEGGASLRMSTDSWGGFGVFLQQSVDLSAYENGDVRFFVKTPRDLKVEFQCLGGATLTAFIGQHGWNGNNTWQEISIPVCDFFSDGVCVPACLADIGAPFMSTIEGTTFAEFRVDHVRWQTANSHSGASSVQVQGRQLLVDGEPFVVNGMAYAPISIGENWQGAWRDRPDRYLVDFPLIAASGANTVRLYAPVLTKAMLDAAWAAGLYVIPTYQPDTAQLTCAAGRDFMRDRFVEMVMDWKDHPAILFWLVGNEVNANLGGTDLCTDWFTQLDSLAAAAHTAEGGSFHPVGTANADVGDICLNGCSDDLTLPNVDLWATQVYRGCSFGSTFAEYAAKPSCDRPLIVTEFGMDAWDSLLGPTGGENQTLQADCLESLLDEADQELAVRTPGGVSSGQVIFAWADEWWKAECHPTTAWDAHDTCSSFTNNAYPDPEIQEEWWGVVSLDDGDPNARGTRTAYTRVGELWHLGPVLNVQVVAHDAPSGNITLSFDPAVGSTDHTLYHGPLSAVSSYGYSGSVTGLGANGSSSVTLPAGSHFWVVAGRNNGAEGCYGKDSACTERPASPGAGIPQSASRSCSSPQCP